MFSLKCVNKVAVLCFLLVCMLPMNYVMAQSVVNVEGLWSVKFEGVEKGCHELKENGHKEGGYTFDVQQQGTSIFSIFDDKTTINIVKGEIDGNLIKVIVKGSTNEGCSMETVLNGQIVDKNLIKGAYSGKFLNCDDCEWMGKFNVDIRKE